MQQGPAQFIALPRPQQAADRGMSALGMVMLLASSGGLILATAVLLTGIVVDATPLVLLGSLSGVRALYHRRAAMAVASGGANAVDALGVYVAVGAVHAIVIGALLAAVSNPATAVHIAALLLVWPAIVRTVHVREKRFAMAGCAASSPPEDNGVGAVAVVLITLGAVGLSVALLVLARVVLAGTAGVGAGLFCAGFAALALRAGVRMRAGIFAQRVCPTRAHHAVAVDLNLSLPTSIAVATVTWAGLSLYAGPLAGVLGAGLAAWAALDWPLAVHRALAIRRFDHHVNGAPNLRAAADRGQSALGWLLLLVGATGLVHTSFSIALAPSLTAATIATVLAAGGEQAVSLLTQTPWWSLAATAAATTAGVALIRSDARASLAGRLFAVVTAAAIVFDWFPAFHAVSADWADVALSPVLAFHLRASALIEIAVAGGLIVATWLVTGRGASVGQPATAALRPPGRPGA